MKCSIKLGSGDKAVELELYYNVKAMMAISERCGGDIAQLGDWMQGGTTTETVERCCVLIAELANGAVYKHNSEIALGLASGEKRNFIQADAIMGMVNPNQLGDYRDAIFAAISGGSEFEIPENVRTEEKDEDLEEIEAMEAEQGGGAKNEHGAATKSGCA